MKDGGYIGDWRGCEWCHLHARLIDDVVHRGGLVGKESLLSNDLSRGVAQKVLRRPHHKGGRPRRDDGIRGDKVLVESPHGVATRLAGVERSVPLLQVVGGDVRDGEVGEGLGQHLRQQGSCGALLLATELSANGLDGLPVVVVGRGRAAGGWSAIVQDC